MPIQAKLMLELLLMHLHMSFDELQLFAGKEGEEEARRVYPALQQWVSSREARQAVWHAGQIIHAAKQLPSHELREFYAIAVYHASLAFWAYGVLSMPARHEARASNTNREGNELVWLDGDETPATKKFLALQRGVPCFSGGGSGRMGNGRGEDASKLSDPSRVMRVISTILRGCNGGVEDDAAVPPPLVENLSLLMRELGNAARAVVGR